MANEPRRIDAPTGAGAELVFLQPGIWGLRAITGEPGTFGSVLDAALADVRTQGGKALHVRLDTGSRPDDAIPALVVRSFERISERAEYEADVAGLPDDALSPFVWETLPDLADATLRDVAGLLERAGDGDPDWGDDDDAFELLKGYLADPALTGGPECVAVGRLGEAPAAVVIAQVNRTTGVGRLTYLGVVREYRGRGLGAWVHRHGFSMLRSQGARIYRGGTLANNHAMLRLFSRHGCREWRRLEEYVWRQG